jgi:hypothetical protein
MTEADLKFRTLFHRAHDVAVELIRAAEGDPDTFQRMHHTKNACLRLAELAEGLGYDLTPRIDADEDCEPEEDAEGDVWMSPEDFALDAADHALMRRQEDDAA